MVMNDHIAAALAAERWRDLQGAYGGPRRRPRFARRTAATADVPAPAAETAKPAFTTRGECADVAAGVAIVASRGPSAGTRVAGAGRS
jgi:hypothetical protein